MRTTFLAGESGSDREVDWAHNTDVSEPWLWLTSGELMLTLGRNLPETSEEQINFIENLSKAGMAGLDVAAGWYAPPLTQEAIEFANEISFPIIQTAYEIPFVLISKTVAESTSKSNQLSKILQMYERYRQSSLNHESPEEQLKSLSKHIDAQITIFDNKNFQVVLPFGFSFESELMNELQKTLAKSPLPAVVRLKYKDEIFLIISMGLHDQVMIVKANSELLDLITLQHLASVVSFIAERQSSTSQGLATAGRRLLSQLLENLLDRELAKERLENFGLDQGPWRLACIQGERIENLEYIHTLFDRKKIQAIATVGFGGLIVLTKSDFIWTEEFLELLVGSNSYLGISSQVNSLGRLADGSKEAQWVLESTKLQGIRIGTYGESDSLFMPRTVAAAEIMVNSILGELIRYEEQNSGDLIKSLAVFFDENLSWQKASKILGIHRQTLNYRMQRVAELTNRNINDLQQMTELYLAVKALRMLDRSSL